MCVCARECVGEGHGLVEERRDSACDWLEPKPVGRRFFTQPRLLAPSALG